MMECPECKSIVREDASFCSNCNVYFNTTYTNNSKINPALSELLSTTDPLINHSIEGKYLLVEQLGAGGMGTVYRARRMLIGDEVAVKVLPQKYVSNKVAIERFRREAQAAAMLRHPNVVAIYDYGEAPDQHIPAYLVMELVPGVTLRKIIQREHQLNAFKAASIIQEVCAGLGAAHHLGLIHRDIKPDNVLVLMPEGNNEKLAIKVVDFGLARLRERTDTERLTETGAILGTPYYMPPEQCRGESLSPQADVYSIGAMMYEMVKGEPPFTSKSITSLILQHLNQPPEPIGLIGYPSVENVILRSLSKSPSDRQHDALQFSSEIQDAIKIDSGNFLVPTIPSYQAGGELQALNSPPPLLSGAGVAASKDSGHQVDYLVDNISSRDTAKQHADFKEERRSHAALPDISQQQSTKRLKYKLAGGIPVLLLTALTLAIYFRPSSSENGMVSRKVFSTSNVKMIKITTNDKSQGACISPDGKYVAYVINESDRRSIWIKHVISKTNMQLLPPSEATYGGLTFSNDSNYIYFSKFEKGQPGQLYQLSMLGGVPRKIMDDVSTPVSFSPNGEQFSFVRDFAARGERSIVVANSDGTGERILATTKLPLSFAYESAWSPDGKLIACAVATFTGPYRMYVIEVNVASGAQKTISKDWVKIEKLAWLPDGSGIISVAIEQGQINRQLWIIPHVSGDAYKITNDLNNYTGVSVTKDGKSIVTEQSATVSNLWVAPAGDASRVKKITDDNYDGNYGLSWTPQDQIVYASGAGGNYDIWVVDESGENRKQVTVNAGVNYYPSVATDGRHIVFASNRTGVFDLWKVGFDGSTPKQLVFSGKGENIPHCCADSDWVVYADYTSGTENIWKVPIEGGNAVQLTNYYSGLPAVSRDGTKIACTYRKDLSSPENVAVITSNNGTILQEIQMPVSSVTPPIFRWFPDNNALGFVVNENGVAKIKLFTLRGKITKDIAEFKSSRIFWFDWSMDGKKLALALGQVNNNAVLISNIN